MIEKVVSIFGLIFVTSFVAKYVGPGIFGKIAFATTIFQLVQVIAQLGSDVIIFKRISKNSISGIKLINATFSLRFIIYLAASLPLLIFFFEKDDGTAFFYIIAVFLSCLFSSLDVYAIYNDARLLSRNNTIINIFGLSVSLILRWFIAYYLLDPLSLCVPIVLTSLIPFVLRLYYSRENFKFRVRKWRHQKKYIKYTLICGSNLVVSSLSVAIYPRLAMLLLGYMSGSYMVGVFSVATTLAGAWAFVCNSIITSSLPGIFSENNKRFAMVKAGRLNLAVITCSAPILVFLYFYGEWCINFLYGEKYSNSFIPLIILSFSTMVSLLGTVSARFIAKYSGYSYLSKKMLFVALISFILNFFLIMQYDIIGAAIATLLTEIISLSIMNYFFDKKVILKMHIKTLLIKPLF